MLNTEYNGKTNAIGVLDAAAQFEFSPKFNVWAGRFLPPSDRANLYGPYYSNHWAVYTDGVQDGYPFLSNGRDNGVMYWGQFDKVKVSGGVFDGDDHDWRRHRARGRPRPGRFLGSRRRLLPEWHLLRRQEPARHRPCGTGAGQRQVGVERRLPAREKARRRGGTVSIESEYAHYNELGGYNSRLRRQRRRLRPRRVSLPEGGRHGQVPGPRQVRPGELRQRPHHGRRQLRPEDDRDSTSTTSSSTSTRA